MMTVILELADGSPVHSLKVPVFLQAPAVIVWGSRTFSDRHHGVSVSPDLIEWHYREVFAWWAPG